MKKIYYHAFRITLCIIIFCIFSNSSLIAQNVSSNDGVNWIGQANSYSEPINNSNSPNVLKYRKVSTSSTNPTDGRGQWKCILNVPTDASATNMSGGNGFGFVFSSGGGNGNTGNTGNKWNFGGTGAGALNAINGMQWTNSNAGQDMGLNMSTSGNYTFVMKDAGYTATGFYVGYTSAIPVTVSHSIGSQLTVNTDRSATVIATTNLTPSSGENVYVRYVVGSNDFSGGTATSIVQASGSTTTWTATIPAQNIGSTIYYYVFTSTISLSTLNSLPQADKSYALLNYADNSGSNYSYTLTSSFSSTTSGIWSNGGTWAQGRTPFDGAAVTIVSPNSVTLDQAANVSSLTINNGATFTASDATARTLTINSNTSATTLSNSGTFAFGSGTSTIAFTGTPSGFDAIHTVSGTIGFQNVTIGKISGTPNIGVAFGTSTLSGSLQINSGGFVSSAPTSFYTPTASLIFNNPGGYTVQSTDATWPFTNPPGSITIQTTTVTMNAARSIIGVLTIGTGATLDLAGNSFTIKSTASATAYIAPIAGTLSGATNVTVERYIPDDGHRAWRLLSVPTSGSQTIYNAWQDGGGNTSNIGTLITSNLYNGSNGFDATSNSPSILIHDQTVPSWTTIPVNNTNATTLDSRPGYMLFVRGDRRDNTGNTTHSATTLRSTGTIRQGTQPTVTVSSTGTGYTLVGNPYASPIDFEAIYTTPNLDQQFMIWDANLSGNYGVGGFKLVERNGGTYQVTPQGTSTPTTDANSRYINSGQAFFLHATGGDASVVFNENSKTNATPSINPFNPQTAQQQLTVNLLTVNAGNITAIADGIRMRYDNSFSATTVDDVVKISNFSENLASVRENKSLIVEKRPLINLRDTIFLQLTGTSIKNYQFEMNAINFAQPNLIASLKDKFLNTSSTISLTGITDINFSVTADPASAVPDRFSIIFAPAVVLPLTFTNASAYQQNNDIAVTWKVENQRNLSQFVVEKSVDGRSFTTVATIAAQNSTSSTYNWLDQNTVTGDNYYRIKSIGISGEIEYTQILKVRMGRGTQLISVYPNPVKGGVINIQFINQPKGMYTLNLVNNLGQVMFSKQINHQDGSSTETIDLDKNITNGVYQLEVTRPDNSKITLKIIF